jgi:tRNA pseudouridine32 synthase/23S rRNA pseudouridine746 synthase
MRCWARAPPPGCRARERVALARLRARREDLPMTPPAVTRPAPAPRRVPDADPYLPPPDTGLELVHEEAGFVVLVKPPGLLSEPGRGADKRDSLVVRAQARWPWARLVHRLDMMTSGLIVVALDEAVHSEFNRLFRERLVHKRYEALVHGRPAVAAGAIDLPLAVDWPNRPRQVVDRERGKPSLTHYRVIGEAPAGLARVALEPVTGRTHQLRVHLAALGHPIAGDPFYGIAAGADAPRMMLHACAIAFPHPAGDGRACRFEVPVPF